MGSSSMNPYSPDKALSHIDRLHDYKQGRVPMPVHIHFVLSDLCNQHCSFCAYRTPGYTETFAEKREDGSLRWNPKRMWDTQDAISLITEFSELGVKAIQFTGGGEPTVHPDFAEIANHAHQLGLETALVTNGTKLDDNGVLNAALSSTWVRISIDHATADGYAAMRSVKPTEFERVVSNVRHLVRIRDEQELNTTIGVGFVVNQDNYKHVFDGVQLAKDIGADNIRLSAVFQQDDVRYYRGIYGEARAQCEKSVQESTESFKVINNFNSRIDDMAGGSPDYKACHYQYFTTYVGGDYNLYRCCVTSYTKRGTIGSLRGNKFIDVWRNQDRTDDMETFDARGCLRCQFNDKNRCIASFLGAEYEHGSFV